MTVYGIGLRLGDGALTTYLKILDFEHNERRRPTYDHLMKVTAAPRSTVQRRIEKLRTLGLVESDRGRTGTIRTVPR